MLKFSLIFWQNEDYTSGIYKDYFSGPAKIFVMIKGKGAGYRIWAKLVTVLTDTTR